MCRKSESCHNTLTTIGLYTVELRFNEVAGDLHCQISSLNQGFVISRFFFIFFTITGAKNTVRYVEVFVK